MDKTGKLTLGTPSLVLALALVSACGGGSEPSQESEDTSGGEEPVAETAPEPEPEPEPEPAPEPVPTGPGQLRVVNRVGGEESGGTVQVLDEAGEVVAEGSSGDTFNVESGSYQVVGQVTDASVLVDTPTHELDGMATVTPGNVTTAHVDFPVSRVRIRVMRGGREVNRWRLSVHLQRQPNAASIELSPSRDYIPISPGRYDGTLTVSGTQIEVTDVIFQGGARMVVPININ